MANPSPTISQQGLGVVPADLLNTYVQVCINYAQLRNFTGLSNMAVYALGFTVPGDGGQQMFYWNSTSTASDNGISVIVPSGSTQGAWLSVSGPIFTITSGFIQSVPLVTATPKTIAQITILPGVWDVNATIDFTGSGTTSVTIANASVSTVTNTPGNMVDLYVQVPWSTPTVGTFIVLPLGKSRITVAASTVYYLVADATFTVSTLTASGIITANLVG